MADQSYFLKSRFVKELSAKDFEEVSTWKLKSKECCAVLFYADWCPHCKALKSEWEEFGKIAGFFEVYAFNCAKHTKHIEKIREDMPGLVRSYPTIIFYSNGNPTETYEGERKHSNFLKACMKVCKR